MGRRRARESICEISTSISGGGRLGRCLAPATTRATGNPDKDEEGIVCFITVAGFLNGPGFRKDARRSAPHLLAKSGSSIARPKAISPMCRRASSRVCSNRSASCSPPASSARSDEARGAGAISRVAKGLSARRNSPRWRSCRCTVQIGRLSDAVGVTLSYQTATGAWATFPALKDLFVYDGSGVMPGRTWVIAPDVGLTEGALVAADQRERSDKKEMLFHPHLQGGRQTRSKKSRWSAGHRVSARSWLGRTKKPVIEPDSLWVSIIRSTMDNSGRATYQSAKSNALEGTFTSAGLFDGT